MKEGPSERMAARGPRLYFDAPFGGRPLRGRDQDP
jgi:hypothetical protein